jgi:predicted XRE-type DNA-binding protein
MTDSIHESTGNVFIDLGFDPDEATVLAQRAAIMNDLVEYFVTSGMSQSQAAEELGLDPAQVSDLVRGRWDQFSLELLRTLEAQMVK